MRAYVRWVTLLGLYLGCAQFAFLAFLQNPGNPDDVERARLTEMVDGTGHRPYVFRSLLPGVVRLIHGVLPVRLRTAVGDGAMQVKPLRKLLDATPAAEERDLVVYLIAYALQFASLLGFAVTLRAAVIYFYAPGRWAADLLPLLAVLGLPVFYRYLNHDYDLPQLFLFSLALLLLAKRRWRWFYPVFVLAAFSKETTLLLVVVHVLGHASSMSTRLLVAHSAAQLAILAGARGLLQFVVFADNPGVPVEFWLGRNWEMISDPSRWGFLFFHFTWVGHQSLVVPTNYNLLFLLLVPLVAWRWREKPVLLRRGLWIAPIAFVLGLLWGYIDEMRIYYEVYVVVFLLMAHTICSHATSEASDQG